MADPVRPVRPARGRERGQVLVIFVLSLTAIFAAAGLAVDIGRLYIERRFLENAADAAALAAANSLIRGNTTADARIDAMAVLTKNFASPPNGLVPTLPPASGSEVYESGHAGDPSYLIDGILINGGDIRVAVRNTDLVHVRARRRPDDEDHGRTRQGRAPAATLADRDPALRQRARTHDRRDVPVRWRHARLPGPRLDGELCLPRDRERTPRCARPPRRASRSTRRTPTTTRPTTARSSTWSARAHSRRTAPASGGSSPSTSGTSSRRRRTSSTTASRPARTRTRSRTSRPAWVGTGYPGPAFPPVTSPPDPDDQIAIMDGNSSGIIIDAID